jgi:hypothetical protein
MVQIRDGSRAARIKRKSPESRGIVPLRASGTALAQSLISQFINPKQRRLQDE